MICNYIWRTLQLFGKEGVVFFIFFISAKLLSPYDFGVYNYSLAFIFFLILFGDFGISTATSKYVAEYNLTNKDKLRGVLFNSGLIILILTVFVSLIAVVYEHYFLKDGQTYIIYLLPLIFLSPMTSLYDGIYRGLKRFKQLAVISGIIGFVSIFIAWFLIKNYGLKGALLSQDIFYLIMLIGLGSHYCDFHFKINKNVMREIGRYSVIVGIAGLGLFIFTRINILILGYFNLITEIGYYEIINKIFAILIIPFSIFSQIISPNITEIFAKKQFKDLLHKYIKYLSASFVVGVLLALFIIIILPLILRSFLPSYCNSEIIFALRLLSIILITQSMSNIASVGFSTPSGHAKVNMFFLLGFGIINVPLSILLVKFYGFYGIVYSTLIIKGLADISFIYYYFNLIKNEKNKSE